MLVNLENILSIAEEEKIGIGAFNCTSLEMLMAIINAAEELKSPVIIQFAQAHQQFIPIEVMAPIMLEFAKKATIPVSVHLDHGESVEFCKKAIDMGFTSVMFDGSALSYEENVEKTKEIVEYAHKNGCSVEAELGSIYGSEIGAMEPSANRDMTPDEAYTHPEQAKDFVEKSGVDALAVAFGTSHGVYLQKPVLDLGRIKLIKEQVDIPLVMHGGSGLSVEEYQTCVRNGIRKINYYTYMAIEGGKAIAEAIKANGNETYFLHDLLPEAIKAIEKLVKDEINIFTIKNEEK